MANDFLTKLGLQNGPVVSTQQLNQDQGKADFSALVKNLQTSAWDNFWGVTNKNINAPGSPSASTPAQISTNPVTEPPQVPPAQPGQMPNLSTSSPVTSTGGVSTTAFASAKPAAFPETKNPTPDKNLLSFAQPSFRLPVSDSTSPFANITPQHIQSLADAVKRGDTPEAFMSQGAMSMQAKSGGPQMDPLEKYTEMPLAGLAAGYIKGEAAAGMLAGIPQVAANLPTTKDEATAPWTYWVPELVGETAGFLMDLSAVSKVLEPIRYFGLTDTAGKFKFLQNETVDNTLKNLAENHPIISKVLFGSAAEAANTMRGMLNQAFKTSIQFGIIDNIKMKLDTPLADRVMGTAQALMSGLLISRLGSFENLSTRTGAYFAFGYGSQYLQNGNKEQSFVQGAIFAAMEQLGGIEALTQPKMDESQFKAAVTNMKQQVPAAVDDLKTIETMIDNQNKQGGATTPGQARDTFVNTLPTDTLPPDDGGPGGAPPAASQVASAEKPQSTQAEAPSRYQIGADGNIERVSDAPAGTVATAKADNKPITTEGMTWVLDELDASRAGKSGEYTTWGTVAGSQEQSSDRVFHARQSTFPDWVPEDLRETKLFNQVSKLIKDGKGPKPETRAAELYDILVQQANKYNDYIKTQKAADNITAAITKEKTNALSSLDNGKVYDSLSKWGSVKLGDKFNRENMQQLQARQIEQQMGGGSVAGDELATNFAEATQGVVDKYIDPETGKAMSKREATNKGFDLNKLKTERTYAKGRGFAPEAQSGDFASHDVGESSDDTERRIVESTQLALTNLEEGRAPRNATPTEAAKSRAKILAGYGGPTDEERTAYLGQIASVKTNGGLDVVMSHQIDKIMGEDKETIKEGNQQKIADIVYDWKPNREVLDKILDAYKKSDGSKKSLVDAILLANGKEDVADTRANAGARSKLADDFVKEFRQSTVKDFKDWLERKFGNVMERVNAFDANEKAISEKINETFRYSKSPRPFMSPEEVEAMKSPDGELSMPGGGSMSVHTYSDEQINAMSEKMASEQDDGLELFNLIDGALRQAKMPKDTEGRVVGDSLEELPKYDAVTHLHERGGHLLDSKFGLTNMLKDDWSNPFYIDVAKELVDNVPKNLLARYPKSEWVSEGLANMMASYFNGDEDFELNYDKAFTFVKDAVSGQNQDLWDRLAQVRTNGEARINAPALATAMAEMHASSDSSWWDQQKKSFSDKGFWQTVKNDMTEAYRSQVNRGAYWEDVDTKTGGKVDDRTSITRTVRDINAKANGLFRTFLDKGFIRNADDILSESRNINNSKFEGKGLVQIWNEVPQEQHDMFGASLVAREFRERDNAARMKGKESVLPNSWSREKIPSIISDAESRVKNIGAVTNDVLKWQDGLLKMLVGRTNGLTNEDYMRLRENPYYASLVRYMGFFEDDPTYNKSQGTLFQKYMGSQRANVVDPFLSSMTEAHSVALRIAKGDALEKLVDFAEANHNVSDKLQVVAPPMRPVAEITAQEAFTMMNAFMKFTPEEEADIKENLEMLDPKARAAVFRPNLTGDPNVRRIVMSDGSVKYLYVDPKLADSLDNKSVDKNKFFDLFGAYTRFKRYAATTMNPDFIINHPSRVGNMAQVTSEIGFIPIVDHLKGLATYSRGMNGVQDDAYDNAYYHGRIGYDIMRDDQSSMLKKLLDIDPKTGKMGVVGDVGRKFQATMTNLVGATEAMVRLGILRKYDMNDPESMTKGFDDMRKSAGDWFQQGLSDSELSQWNKIAMFSKAKVIANLQYLSAAKDNPMRTAKRLAPWVLISAMQQYAMRNDANFHALPSWRKYGFMNIPISSVPVVKDVMKNVPILGGDFVSIPVVGILPAMAWALPGLMGDEINSMKGMPGPNGMRTKGSFNPGMAGDFFKNIISEAVGGTSFTAGAGAIWDAFPDMVKDAAELFSGVDPSTGQKIIPDYMSKLPKSMQYDSYTHNIPLVIAKGFASVFGENSPLSSPAQVDNFLQQTMSGAYTAVAGATDAILKLTGTDQNDLQQWRDVLPGLPLYNRFIHSQYSPSSLYPVQRAVDRYNSYLSTYNGYNALIAQPAQALAYLKKNEVAMRNYDATKNFYTTYTTTLSAYRAVEANTKINDQDRNAQLKNLSDHLLWYATLQNNILDLYTSNPTEAASDMTALEQSEVQFTAKVKNDFGITQKSAIDKQTRASQMQQLK